MLNNLIDNFNYSNSNSVDNMSVIEALTQLQGTSKFYCHCGFDLFFRIKKTKKAFFYCCAHCHKKLYVPLNNFVYEEKIKKAKGNFYEQNA